MGERNRKRDSNYYVRGRTRKRRKKWLYTVRENKELQSSMETS